MYPAALHRFPTQTIHSSQVFERWFFQNQSKIINKVTKNETETKLKTWNRFVPNRLTIFSVDCCRWRQIYLDYSYLLDHSSALRAQFLNNDSRWKKRLNRFKRCFVRSYRQYISHYKILQHQTSPYPFSKQFCLMLRTVKCDLVSE